MVNKKGFLFVVTVFLILTYILLSISVWVKAVEASERAYSEFYKESTVELAIEQITPAKLDNVTNIIMNRALFRLNEHSIDDQLKNGTGPTENEYIRRALFDILVNGSANESNFRFSTAVPEEQNSSLTAWVDNFNASLRAIGVYVSEFEVSNFSIGQSDIDIVNYSFDMTLKLRDYSNTAAVSRTYHINNVLQISGLVDPALARESRDLIDYDHTIYRQFFFNKGDYSNSSSITTDTLDNGEGGQSWFYGYLASASGSLAQVPVAIAVAPSQRHNYILVGNFSDIVALTPGIYEQFGGFIVTTPPAHPSNCSGSFNEANTFNPIKYSGPTCDPGFNYAAGAPTGKPFLVASGFNPTNAPECPSPDGTGANRRCALIIAKYTQSEVANDPPKKLVTGGTGIFGVEDMRDFVMCGYYTHNPDAPSYLQHLMSNSYSRNSSQFGIETFVIGEYANSTAYDLNSRLDRELFNSSIDGIKIRGLPGCRNFVDCSDAPSTGIFAASTWTIADYDLDDIDCNSEAGCD